MYAKEDKDKKHVTLTIQASLQNKFVLGRTFMSHYYTIFDMDNS
jgi:hypothetical protein